MYLRGPGSSLAPQLGCHLPVHDGCQGLDRGSKGLGLSAEMKSGILFSTYATLVSATSAQKQRGVSRLQQLVEWCGGPDFEGCLMLDECAAAPSPRAPTVSCAPTLCSF